MATPISAVALANWRSASATSGRRRNSSIGRPGWMRAGRAGSAPGCRQLLSESFGKVSDQNRDHVSRRIDPGDQRRDLRLQLPEFALRQCDVQLIGDAAIEALLHEIDVMLSDLDALAQDRELHLQGAHLEVGAGHVGDERDQHDVAGGERGLHVVMRRLDLAPQLAEEIELPSGVEADEVVDLREAGPVLGGDQCRRGAAARQIAAGAQGAALGFPRAPAAPCRRRRPPARALPAGGSGRSPASGSPRRRARSANSSSRSCNARHQWEGSTARRPLRPLVFAGADAATKFAGIGVSGGR